MTYELSIVRLATVKTPFENEQGMPGTVRYFFLPVDFFPRELLSIFLVDSRLLKIYFRA